MVNILLTTHLGGAAVVGGLVLLASYALWFKSNPTSLKPLAVGLGLGGGFELFTGSLLSLASEGTFSVFCARIGLYLGVVLLVEGLLFVKMRKQSLQFPTQIALGSIGTGTLMAMFTGLALLAR